MPSSYSFLTFSDVDCMRNKSAKAQIRKHAMKDIGVSRRRPREDLDQPRAPESQSLRPKTRVQNKPATTKSSKAAESKSQDQLLFLDDRALYDPCIRALACATDSFGTACAPLDSETIDLLKFFAHYSSHTPTSFVFLPNVIGSIRYALQDALVLNCLLSAAASRAIHLHGLQVVHFQQKEVTCTQKALETLQDRLKTAEKDLSLPMVQIICGIVYLSAAALYRDDPATAKLHIRFAMKLAEPRGGISKIPDPVLVMRAVGLDDLLACRDLVPCSVKCTYDPGHSPYTQPERRDDQQIDEDCSAAALFAKDGSALPDPLRELISQILGTLRVKRKIENKGHMLSGQALGERQWLIFRTLAIRNRLLAFSPISTIANTLRIALILFTLLPPCESRQERTAQLVAKRLISVLCEITGARWVLNGDLRFWCLLMGYFSVFGTIENAAERWFAVEIRTMIEEDGAVLGVSLGTNLLNDLIAFQRRFLFHELRQRPMTQWLAYDLQRSNGIVECDPARAEKAAEVRSAIQQ